MAGTVEGCLWEVIGEEEECIETKDDSKSNPDTIITTGMLYVILCTKK